MRLIQIDEDGRRSVAFSDKGTEGTVADATTVAEVARQAIADEQSLEETVKRLGIARDVSYAEVIAKNQLLSPVDHQDSAHCLVTGTGLTHLGGAAARDQMHKKANAETA